VPAPADTRRLCSDEELLSDDAPPCKERETRYVAQRSDGDAWEEGAFDEGSTEMGERTVDTWQMHANANEEGICPLSQTAHKVVQIAYMDTSLPQLCLCSVRRVC
jgi:hypothetical protein